MFVKFPHFLRIVSALVLFVHLLKEKGTALLNMNAQNGTFYKSIMDLISCKTTDPMDPFPLIQKLVEEVNVLNPHEPRTKGTKTIMSGGVREEILSIFDTDQEGQLFFELLANIPEFKFVQMGISSYVEYSTLNCPICRRRVSKGLKSREIWTNVTYEPLLLVQFPRNGSNLHDTVIREFVPEQIKIDCTHCQAKNIGTKTKTQFLLEAPYALLVSVQRHDPINNTRIQDPIDIGPKTICLHPGTQHEKAYEMVGSIEHHVHGENIILKLFEISFIIHFPYLLGNTTTTGHYTANLIKDDNVYVVDDDHPIRPGSSADLKNSEIFIFKRI